MRSLHTPTHPSDSSQQQLTSQPTKPRHYTITLTGLSHRAPGAAAFQPVPDLPLPLSVVVDSGTTLSLLPERVVRALAAAFPGAAPDGNGGYTVPCAYQGRDGSIAFSFGGVGGGGGGVHNISVAYRDFVWNGGGGNCFLGAGHAPDVDVWILGDTFLRGAYGEFSRLQRLFWDVFFCMV